MATERVPFRFIVMPCCHHQLCWVNSRLPNYCPECGKVVHGWIEQGVRINDQEATLRYDEDSQP